MLSEEHLDALTDQLLTRPAEHRLRSCGDRADVAVDVGSKESDIVEHIQLALRSGVGIFEAAHASSDILPQALQPVKDQRQRRLLIVFPDARRRTGAQLLDNPHDLPRVGDEPAT